MNYILISFDSPHYTIKADKLLQTAAIKCAIYPIPREISKDCSLGLRIQSTDLEKTLALFKEKNILYQKTFHLNGKNQARLIDSFFSKDQPN